MLKDIKGNEIQVGDLIIYSEPRLDIENKSVYKVRGLTNRTISLECVQCNHPGSMGSRMDPHGHGYLKLPTKEVPTHEWLIGFCILAGLKNEE